MSIFGKLTFGLAIASLVVGQAAFAVQPRAEDPRTGAATPANVVPIGPSATVAGAGIGGADLLIAGLATVAVIGGIAVIATVDSNGEDAPASP